MRDLKRCPFCGGKARGEWRCEGLTIVCCDDCGATCPVDAWNTRAPEQLDAERQEVIRDLMRVHSLILSGLCEEAIDILIRVTKSIEVKR